MKTLLRFGLGVFSGFVVFFVICAAILYLPDIASLGDPSIDKKAYLSGIPKATVGFIAYCFPLFLLLPVCLTVTVGIALVLEVRAGSKKKSL